MGRNRGSRVAELVCGWDAGLCPAVSLSKQCLRLAALRFTYIADTIPDNNLKL